MKIGLFGCGAFGLAISSILIDNGCEITMWSKFEDHRKKLAKERENKELLPGYILNKNIELTCNVEKCIKDKDLIIIAIPAAYVTDLVKEMKQYINNNHILIATKGIEQGTGYFINEIVEKNLNTKNIAVMSGPSFASDIIKKMPVGLTIASKKTKTRCIIKHALANKYIKIRETRDVVGVEICGAIKNVIALAAGMLDGMNANESTKAMMLTEAMKDMEEILFSFGAMKKTVKTYAGIGDLILTCTSKKSRNFSFGRLIGEKSSKQEIDEYLKYTTVEGYYTLKSIYELLKNKKVSIPIIDLIYDIILYNENPESLLTFLVNKN